MKKVAAYRLERIDGVEHAEAREVEVRRCEGVLQEWLRFKQAKPVDDHSGSYSAEDGSSATYRWERAVDGRRSWRFLRTDEASPSGRHFMAGISVTDTGQSVIVYVSLEAGAGVHSSIGPMDFDPKCPRYVRMLLDLSGDWYHGRTKLSSFAQHGKLDGKDSGYWLAKEILATERTVPIVVVSQLDEEPIFPRFADNIAHDLCGIANVYVVDHDASWGLTEELGRERSCYHGAVRLYWPRYRKDDDRYGHPLWTAGRLGFGDDASTEARFRRQLRTHVMEASALSVMRPHEIDEIQAAASRASLENLRRSASSLADFERLADDYATENEKLRESLNQAQTENENLRARLGALEAQQRAHDTQDLEIAPSTPEDEERGTDAPGSGEVRFYKKRDGGNRDRMERLQESCGHSAWQSSGKADKAKKAIAKLESRSDWKNMQHCGTCTGGGVWKVTW